MKYQADIQCNTRTRNRGSALLLVVVLVVLLALMGYAFLFAMRAARVQAVGMGNPVLPQGSWPAVSPTDYGSVMQTAITDAIKRITEAVHTLPPNPPSYLMANTDESRFTAPQLAPYLADRIPTPNATNVNLIKWGFISDIETAGTTRTALSQNLWISQFLVQYPGTTWPTLADGTTPYPNWATRNLTGRFRVFPGFVEDANQTDAPDVTSNNNKVLAADADGDGIADSRLLPTGVVGSLVGAQEEVIFFRAVRIVDNNAAVNVNTARTSTADRLTNATGDIIDPAKNLYAYLGTFRANVGLRELISGEPSDSTDVIPSATADAELGRLDTFRFNGAFATLQNMYRDNTPGQGPGVLVNGSPYITVGDALDHGLASRLSLTRQPAFYGTTPTSQTRLGRFAPNAADQLSYRFVLVNPKFDSGSLVNTLSEGAYNHSANVRDGGVVQQFRFYPADQAPFWYHGNFETDHSAGSLRTQFYAAAPSRYPQLPGGTFNPALNKTIRPHLTGENGVTISTPTSNPPDAIAPLNTTPASWNFPQPRMADYNFATPRKAWANGNIFGELWRAYYDVFKTADPDQVKRFSPDLPTWDQPRHTVLRAAIATINTLQAQKSRNDPTLWRDVPIGAGLVRVFGAKPQPFITEMVVEARLRDPASAYDATSNPVEVQWVAVELHNPYNFPLKISQERLFAVDGTTWTAMADLAGETTDIPANGFRAVALVRQSYTDPLPPGISPTTFKSAAVDALLTVFPAQDSVRLAGWDALTPSPAVANEGFKMIPHDEVDLDTGAGVPKIVLGTQSQRFRYARPTISPQGSRFVCVYNEPERAFDPFTYDALAGMWPANSAGTLGAENTAVTGKDTLVIQVGNYAPYMQDPNGFPFKGLARDGDLLHVAYIGGYSIAGAAPVTCSVTRDAFYAEDADPADDAYEAVGRFLPLSAANFATGTDPYAWAARLFDFVTTIQHPANENVADIVGGTAIEPRVPADTTDTARSRAVQGRININTGGWQAIAAVPLVVPNPNVPAIATGPLARAKTNELAKAIVAYRQANGPFKSIFDLNLVPEFAFWTAGVGAQSDLLTKDLDIAPLNATSVGYGDSSPKDNAIGDFEQRTMGLTRISNLVTTRSDSFTVYILAQAWLRDPSTGGLTSNPILVGEQRAAYLVDRSSVTRFTDTARQVKLDVDDK